MENEKRLIDANSLKEKLQKHHDFFVNAWGGFSNLPAKDKARVDEITHCIAEVVNAPTVDAVEVVRCKDCKHLNAHTIDGEQTLWICTEGWIRNVMPNDDFCSRGERKDNE